MTDLPPAAVERGADWLASGPYDYDAPWDTLTPESQAEMRAQSQDFLTAALRLDDPETVERVAKALFSRGGAWSGWDQTDASVALKDQYRADAHVAISALLGG